MMNNPPGNRTVLFKPLTIFIGGHGTGKSEIALSFLLLLKKSGHLPLTLIDLDVIKPMFRSRGARKFLAEQGIELVTTSFEHSDLPVLGPESGVAMAAGEGWRVVDCGGDAQGVRVLRSLKEYFTLKPYELFYVTNICRPFNANRAQLVREISRIQEMSHLSITGLVSNSHLLGAETADVINRGIEVTGEAGKQLDIPVRFVGVSENSKDLVEQNYRNIPLLITGGFVGFNLDTGPDYGAFGDG